MRNILLVDSRRIAMKTVQNLAHFNGNLKLFDRRMKPEKRRNGENPEITMVLEYYQKALLSATVCWSG